MTSRGHSPDEPEEKPSWLYPLILFGITLAIGAVILFLYLGPSFDDLTGATVRPTSDVARVTVSLGPRRFAIPVNYIHDPKARTGGAMDQIALEALLPDMRGFSDSEKDAIRDVTRDSPVVSITLKAGAPKLSERDRFEQVLKPNADAAKSPYAYGGFSVLVMAGTSGFAGEQVFTRQDGDNLVVFTCSVDDTDHEIGALCRREIPLGHDLTVDYAFRGGHLVNWQDVDQRVRTLLEQLEQKPA